MRLCDPDYHKSIRAYRVSQVNIITTDGKNGLINKKKLPKASLACICREHIFGNMRLSYMGAHTRLTAKC